MAEPKPFTLVKLVCGIIYSEDSFLKEGQERLVEYAGPIDRRSPVFEFRFTDYYAREMGPCLRRLFVSFSRLIQPESLSDIKLHTNSVERDLGPVSPAGRPRVINLDPGYLTPSALIMATAKDFSHRIPLQDGIYAHLELMFTKGGVRFLDWTYPDFRTSGYGEFFLAVRKSYLSQVKTRLRSPA